MNFNNLTEDEQIAHMRKFLNENYKVSDERADSKITHNFTIIYDDKHIEIILQFVNTTNSQKETYVQLKYETAYDKLNDTIKSLKKLNYLKTKIKEIYDKIEEIEAKEFL